MPRHYPTDPGLPRKVLLTSQLLDLDQLLAAPRATHECVNLAGKDGTLLTFDCAIAPPRRHSLELLRNWIENELADPAGAP